MNQLPKSVRIIEVGPRDGLQNEPEVVDTANKAEYIRLLSLSGISDIEVTSFVSPRRVPQLADADTLAASLPLDNGIRYSALAPNRKGLDRALNAGMRHIALFTAASETFSLNNTGMTVEQSLHVIRELAPAAHAAGCSVRAYVSTAFFCPFEGRVSPDRVLDITGKLLDMGVDEVSIGDTIGFAAPTDVAALLERLSPTLPVSQTACHFHDTRGFALANVLAALQCGIAVFDSASGGLGGCPFAPGAAGNLATEDLVLMLDGMGIETGVDVSRVAAASRFLASVLHRPLPGKALQALP